MQKETLHQNAYEDLANAIVIQAARDYADAFWGKDIQDSSNTPEEIMKDVEKFFHSDWYKMLTKSNPDRILQDVKLLELCNAIGYLEKALVDANRLNIKLIVLENKKHGVSGMNFTIPPRLMDMFFYAIHYCKIQLENERRCLIDE